MLCILIGLILEKRIPAFHQLMHHGKTASDYSRWKIHKSYFWHFYAFGIISLLTLLKRTPLKILLLVHLVRRLLECLFLFNYSSTSYMHFAHYFVGMTYYPMLMLCVSELPHKYYVIRMCLFILFSIVQCRCHFVLTRLKMQNKTYIPRTGIFKMICCPHYLMEVLMYSCLCLNRNLFLNFLFTLLNLAVSAHKTKHWMQKNENTIINRCAIIPFIL